MKFEWKIEKDKELTFEDRVHNLACFEVVLNILIMKTKTGEQDLTGEMQALCGFALECMFKGSGLDDDELFDSIMLLKNSTVHKFRDNILKGMGIPKDALMPGDVGEA